MGLIPAASCQPTSHHQPQDSRGLILFRDVAFQPPSYFLMMFYFLWLSSTKDNLNANCAHKRCYSLPLIILQLLPCLFWYWSIRDERTLSTFDLPLSNIFYTTTLVGSDLTFLFLLWWLKNRKRPLQIDSLIFDGAVACGFLKCKQVSIIGAVFKNRLSEQEKTSKKKLNCAQGCLLTSTGSLHVLKLCNKIRLDWHFYRKIEPAIQDTPIVWFWEPLKLKVEKSIKVRRWSFTLPKAPLRSGMY